MGALVGMNATDTGCDGVDGGIVKSWGVDRQYITSVTVSASDEITNFVMDQAGRWAEYTPDDEDSAFFNETGATTGKKISFNQNAFLKFPGIGVANTKITNDAIACCDTVWIHELSNGVRKVQGYDIRDNEAVELKTKPRIVPNSNSNTGADEDAIEWNIPSVSRKLAPTTTLDRAAIAAL